MIRQYSPRSILIGASMIALAFFGVSLMLTLAKFAAPKVPNGMILFSQNAVCLVIAGPLVLRNGWRHFATRHPVYHLIRAATGLGTFFFLYLALEQVPLADATLLNSSAPIFLPLITYIWIREHIAGKAWWGIIVGFIGLSIALHPGPQLFNPWSLFALASGITMAWTMTAMKALGRTETNYLIIFYYAAFSCLVTLPFVIIDWVTPGLLTTLAILAVGLLFAGVQALIISGYRRGPAGILAPLSFFSVIFAGFFDWALWDHVPHWIWFIGAALVILGGSWTVYVGRNHYKITK